MGKRKCCATCEYWLKKYQKCENPEQFQSESNDYGASPDKCCELWESNGGEDGDNHDR